MAYAQKGKFNEGIALLEKAIALAPELAIPVINLGRVLDKKGDRDQSIAVLQKAIALDKSNASSYRFLGLAYIHSGDFLQAIGWFLEI